MPTLRGFHNRCCHCCLRFSVVGEVYLWVPLRWKSFASVSVLNRLLFGPATSGIIGSVSSQPSALSGSATVIGEAYLWVPLCWRPFASVLGPGNPNASFLGNCSHRKCRGVRPMGLRRVNEEGERGGSWLSIDEAGGVSKILKCWRHWVDTTYLKRRCEALGDSRYITKNKTLLIHTK